MLSRCVCNFCWCASLRVGTKKRGGSYARSEAELEQIVDGLYEQEVSIASVVSYSYPNTILQGGKCMTNVIKTSLVMEK